MAEPELVRHLRALFDGGQGLDISPRWRGGALVAASRRDDVRLILEPCHDDAVDLPVWTQLRALSRMRSLDATRVDRCNGVTLN